ncbi:ATP-binding protein [Microbacterium sp. S1037]|uniref:sensor histidine kinase n=1 Tax=Microbacterium sp. S1037 TaxID=3398227 RepID=UPI003AB00C0B
MNVDNVESGTTMHFDVHPSVLFKLGEDLITDDAQALSELIKNSYDADARTVRVTIDTLNWYSLDTGEVVEDGDSPNAVLGMLRVTDNGTGMTLDAIRDGWLTVSYSQKRELKAAGGKTRGTRVPLGDKGLGRLGVQRLGRAVMLDTVPASRYDDPAKPGAVAQGYGREHHRLIIDWHRFAQAQTLGSVSLGVETEFSDELPSGSTITVLGLASRGYWTSQADADLQRELATVISPYRGAADLTVSVSRDKRALDVRQQAEEVLSNAPWHMTFFYNAGALTVRSEMRHSVLGGRNAAERRAYRELIVADGGFSFAESLRATKPKRAAEVGLMLGDDEYFLRFERTIQLADVAPQASFADPGPFHGEISSYSLSEGSAAEDLDGQPSFTRADWAEFGAALSGIRVFRDGFGIRLPQDWLNLSAQQTSGSSFYGLRPKNTAGYVNLTVEHNSGLEETSNRESFRDTPAWRAFFALMTAVTNEARRCFDLVRREWNERRRDYLTPAQVPESSTPAEIVEHIERQLVAAQGARQASTGARESVTALAKTVDRLVASSRESEDSLWADSALRGAVELVAQEVQGARERIDASLREVDATWAILQELAGSAALLQQKLDTTERRLAGAWESVALGLSAELLAHEVDNIGERLRGRAYQITDYLRSLEPRDPRTLAFAEQVRASANELLKQSARLNPALQFRRDRKTVANLSSLLTPIVEYHAERLAVAGVEVSLTVAQDFRVRANEGKLVQVLDNLILNAEYWVKRSLQQERISVGRIEVRVAEPRFTVTDNGPGVDPSVQDSLFDAFVTTKPELHGRGLGLFVVKQLLAAEDASIELLEDPGAQGRPSTFEIDLRNSVTSDAPEEVAN